MLLTKKAFRKILIIEICYFVLGSICTLLAINFENMGADPKALWYLSAITYLLCIPIFFAARYSEGEGKLVLLGGKLVQRELKPGEFLKEYEALRNSDDLVINKPSVALLTIVTTAYDALNDEENVLKTLDEMIAVAGQKKIAYATVLKAATLYSHNKIEEAEELFAEVQQMKRDAVCTVMIDVTLKSDRAMAMGDYKVAEAYFLQLLERKFPKVDNLMKLVSHFQLGVVYENMKEAEKAASHYRYCINNGGETAMRVSAVEKLQNLKCRI